jgi:hypothetical protein
MTDHDPGGCHGRLARDSGCHGRLVRPCNAFTGGLAARGTRARPCDAFTGGQADLGTRSHWSIFSHQLPYASIARASTVPHVPAPCISASIRGLAGTGLPRGFANQGIVLECLATAQDGRQQDNGEEPHDGHGLLRFEWNVACLYTGRSDRQDGSGNETGQGNP